MKPIVQRLSLAAYRGMANLALEGMAPVNLIVGPNNAGKSSILEAASLVLRPPDPRQWINAVRCRDADLALAQGLWSMFPGAQALHLEDGAQQSALIVLDAQLRDATRHVEASATAVEVLGSADGADVNLRVDVSVNGDPPIELRFTASKPLEHEVPMYRVFTVTPSLHNSTDALVQLLSEVIETGRKQLAVELLKIFDPRVEDLDIITSSGRHAVYVTHKRRGVVDLSSFGEGMRRGAALALAFSRVSQGVLLVDEIEAGIHHRIQQRVFTSLLRTAKDLDVQVIATTHSLEAVDALISALQEEDEAEQSPDAFTAYWLRRHEGRHEIERHSTTSL